MSLSLYDIFFPKGADTKHINAFYSLCHPLSSWVIRGEKNGKINFGISVLILSMALYVGVIIKFPHAWSWSVAAQFQQPQ